MYNINSAAKTDSLSKNEVKPKPSGYLSGVENEIPFRIKVLKTTCMMSLYVGLGLWSGVISPSTVDIVELYHCTYEHFVRATTMKAIGAMCGSFIGAIVMNHFSKRADLVLFVLCFVGGLCCVAIPWSHGLILMGVLFSVTGVSHGAINVVCTSVCLMMWQQSAGASLHGLQMCFTIGATLAPLITLPFLSKSITNSSSQNMVNYQLQFNSSSSVSSIYSVDNEFIMESPSSKQHIAARTHVQIPYAIFGIWIMVVSIAFLVFFLKKIAIVNSNRGRRDHRNTCKDFLNPGACAGGSKVFGMLFITFILVIYILIQGRERGLAAYLFVIANKGILHLSKPHSAVLVTAYNACTAAGRGINGFVSKYVKIHFLLFGQILTGTFLQMLMLFYGLDSVTSLWVLSCLAAAFMGPTLPTFMGWLDIYVNVNSTVVAVMDIGLAVGSFIALWTNGHLYEIYGTVAVFWVGFVLGAALVLVLLVFQIIVCIKGEKSHTLQLNVNDNAIYDDTDDENSPLLSS